jgi:hypothetical protein
VVLWVEGSDYTMNGSFPQIKEAATTRLLFSKYPGRECSGGAHDITDIVVWKVQEILMRSQNYKAACSGEGKPSIPYNADTCSLHMPSI